MCHGISLNAEGDFDLFTHKRQNRDINHSNIVRAVNFQCRVNYAAVNLGQHGTGTYSIICSPFVTTLTEQCAYRWDGKGC